MEKNLIMDRNLLKEKAKAAKKSNKKLVKRLERVNGRKLDQVVSTLHDEVFEKIDCLTCANCCSTTSPLFKEKDIERLSKHLGMKAGDFVQEYLRIDEDDDYVFKGAPCPFLGADNYCSVYEARPRACREYPHTDRKQFQQILQLSLKNTSICPAVYEVFESLKQQF